jgi:hypothetical protein
LGLLAVLHYGAAIKPTVSVGGSWRADTQKAINAALECRSAENASAPWPLAISQSGRDVTVWVGDGRPVELRGRVDGPVVTAARTAAGTPVFLHADVKQPVDVRELVGTIRVEHCPSQDPVDIPVHATLERSSRKKDGSR